MWTASFKRGLLATCLISFYSCDAACPNLCNNNGLCGINNVCLCHEGFTGPDCSRRICPYGTAWTDKTTAIDTAHAPAECSGAGLCDSNQGECRCFKGFTGHACQRSKCHNDCRNRGLCISMADLAMYHGKDYDPTSLSAGDGYGPVYSNWEANSLLTCQCDFGFFGPDCSLVMCPKGDDPVTVNQEHRQIQLDVTDAGASFTGHLGLTFQGSTSYLSLGDPSSLDCETVLEMNPKFEDVTCVYTAQSATVSRFDITFVAWPRLPKENNLHFHTGNPDITEFLCDVTRTDSTVTCAFTDVVSSNLREYDYCSNRGICDFTSGTCLCATGYGGIACDTEHTAYIETTNAQVFQQVAVKSSDFVSTAVNINTVKSPSPDFNLLEAKSNSKSFYVRGDGVVGVESMRVVEAGLTVQLGGVMVEGGGVNITADGAIVTNAEATSPVISAQSTDEAYDDTVLEVRSMGVIGQEHLIVRAVNQGFTRLGVRGDGFVSIADAGVSLTGGMSVASGGLSATAGITVSDGGLTVTGGVSVLAGDVTIYDGVEIHSLGLLVRSGGATIESAGVVISQGGLGVEMGGETISSGGLVVSAGGVTIASGGVTVTGGVSVESGGMKVTDGFSVSDSGLTVSGGMTVINGGTKVEVIGLSIAMDGAVVGGGLSVNNDGVTVTNGLSVYSGLVVTVDGATVQAGGVTVDGGTRVYTGGIDVEAVGVVLTGGLSVISGGLKVTAGMTVDSGGLIVAAAGSSVSATGMKVAGGLTVVDTGLEVTLGGLESTGGVTILSSGANIVGTGVTVVEGGLVVTTGGFSVNANGLKVAGGLSIVNGVTYVELSGVDVAGGLSVGNLGVSVKDGVTVVNTGLYVVNTGMTVLGGMFVAGGVSVLANGVTVSTGGVKVAGGLTLENLGLLVSGANGVTISNTGLAVAADGVSVNTGGLKVAGGTTISSGGLDIDVGGAQVVGGVFVELNGMKVSGGLTLLDTGIAVQAGGASVSAGGLKVAGGVSVSTNGVHVTLAGVMSTGGVSVMSGGVKVNGGLTLPNTGLLVSAGGGTISGGLGVQNGLTVGSSVLVINDGLQAGGFLSVHAGMKVATGMTVSSSSLSVAAGGVSITGGVTVLLSMTVSGNVMAAGLVQTSDRRLKTNVQPLKDNLAKVTKLRGVYFNWRKDSLYGNHTERQVGVIAQDVQAVFPEATVGILGGDYLGVDYTQLIPVLVEALRELSDNFAALSETYDELDARTQGCG